MVADFQDGAGAPLLLVSLKAGGTGLNLTAASQVIHYDRWWNPAVEDQATDRAWRIGQQRTVNVHKLVCQGTVEERIGEVIDEKRAIADAVVGTGEAWLSELSTDELARLVMLEDGERAKRARVTACCCRVAAGLTCPAACSTLAMIGAPVKPRKPFGPNPPGRLPATMIKVLAAELSDQGRLARGKRYWADDAVIDLVIGHGAVTAEIQGSRPEPYVVTIEAAPGTGVPGRARRVDRRAPAPTTGSRRGLQARRGGAVRAVRRGRHRARPDRTLAQGLGCPHRARPWRRPLPAAWPRSCRCTRDPGRRPSPIPSEQRRSRSRRDRHAARRPQRHARADFPEVTPIAHAGIRDRQLADVLDDALDHLAINWD